MGPLLVCLLSAPSFFLHEGDRVVFYGDSITEQQRYTTYLETFVRCRLPNMHISFFSAGWGGDTVHGTTGWEGAGGEPSERIARDVAPERPTLVTVMLGMNDGYYYPVKPEWRDDFRKSYQSLLDLLAALPGKPRLSLFPPTPWDDFTRTAAYLPDVANEGGGYNDTLADYSKVVAELAKTNQASFVDLNTALARDLRKAASLDPELATSMIPDRIHPEWSAALLAALEIARAWNLPAEPISVEIADGRLESAQGTKVDRIDELSWRQLDQALPCPYDTNDPATQLAARASDFDRGLNRRLLRFRGARFARASLEVDGVAIGEFTSEELARGVELPSTGPEFEQARAVFANVQRKNQLQLVRWREIDRANQSLEAAPEASRALRRLVEQMDAHTRELAQPVARIWRLKPLVGAEL